MRVKAPAEKNFRRAKVKPGRRKARRFRLSWRLVRVALAAVVVVYGAYRCFALVLNATALQVSRIALSGNVRLSRGEVQQLVHGLRGANILTVDLVRYRRAILDSPWVAEATLRRVLPSTVEISIVERQPFGISRLRHQLYLVDREGTVIDEFGPQYAEFDLPIIDGLVTAPRDGKPAIDPERAQLAAKVVDSLAAEPSLVRRLSQIDVSDVHNAAVLLEDDPALLYLGEEKFRERLKSYLEVADAIREGVPSEIDYVDLRFGQRVFAGQRKGATGTTGKRSRGGRSY
jgi:cell division septal protein FtsQ